MKRMDDNELGKREKEVNCLPSYQCPPGEKGFYTLASNENETILKLKQEEKHNAESLLIQINEGDTSSEKQAFDSLGPIIVAPEAIDNTKDSSDKLLGNLDQIKSHTAIVNDTTDFDKTDFIASNDNKDSQNYTAKDDSSGLLKNVSPLHSFIPNSKQDTDNTECIQTNCREVDYISETYRNIVKQINDVSAGFKNGKKWKCSNPAHCHHHHNHQHYHQPHCRQYATQRYSGYPDDFILERGKDTLLLKNQKIKEMEDAVGITHMESDSVFEHDSNEGRERVLVRQMATEHSHDYNPEDIDYYDDDEDIAIVIESESHQKTFRNKRMLGHAGKHWTIDCGTMNVQSDYPDIIDSDSLKPNAGGSANTIPAFLIRPISRNSLRSSNGQCFKRPLSISPNTLSAAVAAASGNVSGGSRGRSLSNSNKEFSIDNNGRSVEVRYKYNKKMHSSCKLAKYTPSTSRKAPIKNEDASSFTPFISGYSPCESGLPINHERSALLKQNSDKGTYGSKERKNLYVSSHSGKIEKKHQALLDSVISSKMKSSHSHNGIAMLRDNSCSLVDIPTYLVPSVQACGGVEVLTVNQDGNSKLRNLDSSAVPVSNQKTMRQPLSPLPNNDGPSIPLSSTDKRHSCGKAKSQPPETVPLDIDYREKQALREKIKLKKQRKAKCTVLCVSILLLAMCVTLVGTMLSFGSQYQDRRTRNCTLLSCSPESDPANLLLLPSDNKNWMDTSTMPTLREN